MKRHNYLFKMSWLVTGPIACLFIYWSASTIRRYIDFEIHHPHYSEFGAFRLYDVGVMEFRHFIRFSSLSVLSRNKPLPTSNFETIFLYVSESNIDKLNSHLPHSGDGYVKGGMRINGSISKIKLRYRGDSNYHWGYYKKSLRIKTKKSKLFKGMRKFNLVAPRSPEILNNYLCYKLGKQLGLITPHVEIVNVVMNGVYQGIYILTEQIEESTLRSNGMMPGDIYSGELVLQDSYTGINNNLFDYPNMWKKVAFNNHYDKTLMRPIETLTKLVKSQPSEKLYEQIEQIIDIEAFGKFNALEILSCSSHIDNVHNWRLYYDPMRGRFFPIVWDLFGWYGPVELEDGTPRIDVITSELHSVLYKNANFLQLRNQILYDFFDKDMNSVFLKELKEIIQEVKLNSCRDPNIAAHVKALSDDEINKALSTLYAKIETTFKNIENAYTSNNSVSYAIFDKGNYKISISGQKPVNKLTFQYYNEIPKNNDINGYLIYYLGNTKKNIDITEYLDIKSSSIILSFCLMQGYIQKIHSMIPGRNFSNRLQTHIGYYEIKLSGIDKSNTLIDMMVERGKGVFERATPSPIIEKYAFENLYNLSNGHNDKRVEVWSGEKYFDGITTIVNDIYIEKGAKIYLDNGSSIIFKGRVNANGSKEFPIYFQPIDENSFWGTVAIVGELTVGTSLNHVVFSKGSGLKQDLIEYTAMLSIHDTNSITIQNCSFTDSNITDDMVHVVYSDIHFIDCLFQRSHMDALDIDISQAVIERCHFINSGNDAIDLMTSKAVVTDTIIEMSGDKATSVGERSRLLAINSLFKTNAIGVQAKDSSQISLYNLSFIDNAHAIDAYKKNWRYGSGGKIFVNKTFFSNNKKMFTADKNSSVLIFDSFIDCNVENSSNLQIDQTVDQLNKHFAKTSNLMRYPDEVVAMNNFNNKYWKLIKPKIRGAYKVAVH